MNIKIFNRLQQLIKSSPIIMIDKQALKVAITSTFDVQLEDTQFSSVLELSNMINDAVMKKYFATVWQPKTKKYKYSGLSIIDEVNSLNMSNIVDLGCGYNEFSGKIANLTGVDPYNERADVNSTIMEYNPEEKADVVICLGSVNFGSVDNVFLELNHIVEHVVKPGGLIFFRGNPGEMHDDVAAKWIEFFEWTPEFIINSAKALDCIPAIIRQDTDRLFFVWQRNY